MKHLKFSITILMLTILVAVSAFGRDERDVLYQVSTINALMKGVYEGEVPVSELSEHGDIGIGTFDALDGEMVVIDGTFYKMRVDGKAYPAEISEKTPFAVLTFFDSDNRLDINDVTSLDILKKELDKLLPSKNLIYAFRVDGTFERVKFRTVARQDKPYRVLAEVVEDEKIFELDNVKGTLVGFKFPSFINGMNVPGYHFHFISEDRSTGGHLLDCVLRRAVAHVDVTPGFFLVFPENGDFLTRDLAAASGNDLAKVESGNE